ncbi:hypothetical protein K5549_018228, partial [Capra hircus]
FLLKGKNIPQVSMCVGCMFKDVLILISSGKGPRNQGPTLTRLQSQRHLVCCLFLTVDLFL